MMFKKKECMQKPTKTKGKILRFLPRTASAVIAFQNLPFSPGRGKIGANHHHRFSGPLIPYSGNDEELGLEAPEPGSPKISCMGQIKHKKNKIKARSEDVKVRQLPPPERASRRKRGSKLMRMFSTRPEKRTEPSVQDISRLPDRAPSLSPAQRIANGRDVLADFDWTAPFSPVDMEHRNYYSDDEGRGRTFTESDDGEEDNDEEEVIIPFSAPLSAGGLGGVGSKPRKEVNLWKRRTMAPPRPLQLHTTMVRAN